MPVRYRYEGGTTYRMESKLHHIQRLGKIHSIKGYRFRSTRNQNGSQWTTTYERVMIKGEYGSCVFDGVCWGYGGSGPHGLKRLLLACKLPKALAEKIAFEAPRLQITGTDWSVSVEPDKFSGRNFIAKFCNGEVWTMKPDMLFALVA